MNIRRKEIVFKWFIENYSYCWHKNGESLASPDFSADDLQGTVWKLLLYPRGETCNRPGNVVLFLRRSSEDDGPEDFTLNVEIACLAVDGSILYFDEFKKVFQKGVQYGCEKELPMYEILVQRKTDYLPQDTLTVCCTIWVVEDITGEITEISARTRIEIEKFSFLHVIEDFNALKPNEIKTMQIKHPSKKGCTITNSVYVTYVPCFERKIMVKTVPNNSNQTLCKYKISLLNASGALVKYEELENRCDARRPNIDEFPLSFTEKAIVNQKSECLPDGKLSVFCECVFSNGADYKVIEKILYKMPSVVFDELSDDDQSIDEEDLSDYTTALEDLIAVYNSQFLTDVELKTKTKSFSAHKIILCARSSVFKVMMSNDLREKNTGCIEIHDLDDDTVQQLLFFIYSDKLQNLKWETATKLYYAANKYEITKLKSICSDFLAKNLSTSTAAEVLVLASKHNDFDLKETVENFILEHQQQVFGSDAWKTLMETDS